MKALHGGDSVKTFIFPCPPFEKEWGKGTALLRVAGLTD